MVHDEHRFSSRQQRDHDKDWLRHRRAGKGSGHEGRTQWKVQALIKLVERTVTTALANEIGDTHINDLTVVEVIPAPDASRFCVVVLPPNPNVDVADVQARLAGVRSLLRARLAEVVTRKRVPDLTFAVLTGKEADYGA